MASKCFILSITLPLDQLAPISWGHTAKESQAKSNLGPSGFPMEALTKLGERNPDKWKQLEWRRIVCACAKSSKTDRHDSRIKPILSIFRGPLHLCLHAPSVCQIWQHRRTRFYIRAILHLSIWPFICLALPISHWSLTSLPSCLEFVKTRTDYFKTLLTNFLHKWLNASSADQICQGKRGMNL